MKLNSFLVKTVFGILFLVSSSSLFAAASEYSCESSLLCCELTVAPDGSYNWVEYLGGHSNGEVEEINGKEYYKVYKGEYFEVEKCSNDRRSKDKICMGAAQKSSALFQAKHAPGKCN